MTNEKYERANEIKTIQECFENLYSSIRLPHPKMIDAHDNIVCFIKLGEKYEKELKDLISNYIIEKSRELNQEFKEL